MSKPSTRERILTTALGLFNNEGERQVSAVDIAAVMGISPGNLHYHFKGKDLIIAELFDRYDEEIRLVLSAPIKEPLAIEDNWVFLYIIFEEIYDFRFFYNNMVSILERIPELAPKFSRILSLKTRTFDAMLGALMDRGAAAFHPDERQALAERIAMHFTYWLQYHTLRYPSAAPRDIINHGVYAGLVQIVPYWRGDADGFSALLSEFLDAQG